MPMTTSTRQPLWRRRWPALWFASAGLLGLAGSAPAQDAVLPSYRIDPGHTFVHWEVVHMGTSTSRGRFDRLDGALAFDARRQALDIGVQVDTRSVSTGSAPFDAVLRGAQLLDADAHPQAWLVARRAEFEGEVPRRVHGEITLRGQSAPLTLTATRWRCGLNLLFRREVCGGDFEARLSRAAFGMTLAAGLVADEVLLRVQVEAVRADPPAAASAPQ
jgi:polyisoprenoid-binding protein YceI